MYSGAAFNQKYLDGTLVILQQAARMSVQVQGADQDTQDYLRELREVIIDQYIAILIAAGDTNCLEKFNNFLEGIFDFLENTAFIEGL